MASSVASSEMTTAGRKTDVFMTDDGASVMSLSNSAAKLLRIDDGDKTRRLSEPTRRLSEPRSETLHKQQSRRSSESSSDKLQKQLSRNAICNASDKLQKQLSRNSISNASDKLQKQLSRNSMSNASDAPGGASMLRRRSTFRGFAHSLTGMLKLRRLTQAKIDMNEPKVRYENTYKTDPDDGNVFRPDEVNRIATEIIEQDMRHVRYEPTTCGNVACELAAKVKAAVKATQCPRYKIICHVILGEVRNQGIEAASRCVWDERRDNYTCVSYRNSTVFVSATIHGIYFE